MEPAKEEAQVDESAKSGLAPISEVGAGDPAAAIAPAGCPIVVQSANDSYTLGTSARGRDVGALQAFFAYLLYQPPPVLPDPVEVGDAWTAVASLDLRITATDGAEMDRLESAMQQEAELTRIWRSALRGNELSADERARLREPENVARAVAHIYRQFNSGLSLRCTEGTPLADVDLAAFSAASLQHIYSTWSKEDSALRKGMPFLPSLDQSLAAGLAAGRQEFLVEGLVDPALHHAAQTGAARVDRVRQYRGVSWDPAQRLFVTADTARSQFAAFETKDDAAAFHDFLLVLRHGNRVARQRINFPSCFPAYIACAAAPTEEEAHERFRNDFLPMGKAREAATALEEQRESPRDAIGLRSGSAGDGTALTRHRARTRQDNGSGASAELGSTHQEGEGEGEGGGGGEEAWASAAQAGDSADWGGATGWDPDPAPAFNIRWVAPVYVVHVSDAGPCREQWRFEVPPGVDVPRLFRSKLHACLYADASAMRYHGTSLPPRLNYPALTSLIGYPLRGAGARGARAAVEAQLELLTRIVDKPLTARDHDWLGAVATLADGRLDLDALLRPVHWAATSEWGECLRRAVGESEADGAAAPDTFLFVRPPGGGDALAAAAAGADGQWDGPGRRRGAEDRRRASRDVKADAPAPTSADGTGTSTSTGTSTGTGTGTGTGGRGRGRTGRARGRSSGRSKPARPASRGSAARSQGNPYRGVRVYGTKWQARITVNGQLVSLGYFWTAEDAARAFDNALFNRDGPHASFNLAGEIGPGGRVKPVGWTPDAAASAAHPRSKQAEALLVAPGQAPRPEAKAAAAAGETGDPAAPPPSAPLSVKSGEGGRGSRRRRRDGGSGGEADGSDEGPRSKRQRRGSGSTAGSRAEESGGGGNGGGGSGNGGGGGGASDARKGAKKFRGVRENRFRGTWEARISLDGEQRSLGHFPSVREAAQAYDRAALRRDGSSAKLNYEDSREAFAGDSGPIPGLGGLLRSSWPRRKQGGASAARARSGGARSANGSEGRSGGKGKASQKHRARGDGAKSKRRPGQGGDGYVDNGEEEGEGDDPEGDDEAGCEDEYDEYEGGGGMAPQGEETGWDLGGRAPEDKSRAGAVARELVESTRRQQPPRCAREAKECEDLRERMRKLVGPLFAVARRIMDEELSLATRTRRATMFERSRRAGMWSVGCSGGAKGAFALHIRPEFRSFLADMPMALVRAVARQEALEGACRGWNIQGTFALLPLEECDLGPCEVRPDGAVPEPPACGYGWMGRTWTVMDRLRAVKEDRDSRLERQRRSTRRRLRTERRRVLRVAESRAEAQARAEAEGRQEDEEAVARAEAWARQEAKEALANKWGLTEPGQAISSLSRQEDGESGAAVEEAEEGVPGAGAAEGGVEGCPPPRRSQMRHWLLGVPPDDYVQPRVGPAYQALDLPDAAEWDAAGDEREAAWVEGPLLRFGTVRQTLAQQRAAEACEEVVGGGEEGQSGAAGDAAASADAEGNGVAASGGNEGKEEDEEKHKEEDEDEDDDDDDEEEEEKEDGELAALFGWSLTGGRSPHRGSEWSGLERRLFERAMHLFPKDLPLVSEVVGTKTTRCCVDFYYGAWRSLRQFGEWKKARREGRREAQRIVFSRIRSIHGEAAVRRIQEQSARGPSNHKGEGKTFSAVRKPRRGGVLAGDGPRKRARPTTRTPSADDSGSAEGRHGGSARGGGRGGGGGVGSSKSRSSGSSAPRDAPQASGPTVGSTAAPAAVDSVRAPAEASGGEGQVSSAAATERSGGSDDRPQQQPVEEKSTGDAPPPGCEGGDAAPADAAGGGKAALASSGKGIPDVPARADPPVVSGAEGGNGESAPAGSGGGEVSAAVASAVYSSAAGVSEEVPRSAVEAGSAKTTSVPAAFESADRPSA